LNPLKAMCEPASQELREAWCLALERPDWAERLAAELAFLAPGSALDGVLMHLTTGPRLFGLWSTWREELRQPGLGPERVQQVLDGISQALRPSPEFAAHHAQIPMAQRLFGSVLGPLAVDAFLWRSPQPRLAGLEYLRDLGVRQVICLRQESDQSERLCGPLGLTCHKLSVTDMDVPDLDQVSRFLDWVGPGREPGLVHCQAGQGRTGVFVACYRIHHGMNPDEAVARSDAEIFSRGMRLHQRQWVLDHALSLSLTKKKP
jgi:protein tyrosine phosphatase (PTP) superfamily phosphohydrolase (DUF442 family)